MKQNQSQTKKNNTNSEVKYFTKKSDERGYFDHGWLKSFHSFSFGDYYDPNWMNFYHLRVINDDWIAKASGFPLHGHKHMEIVSIILSGQIEHKDTLGHSEVIPVGHIQVMNAGTGIRHSEFNPSKTEDLRLLQVWIEPNSLEIQPGYKRYDFSKELELPGLCFLKNLNIHQNINIALFQTGLESNKLKNHSHESDNLATNRSSLTNNDQFVLKKGQSLWIQSTKDDLQVELSSESNNYSNKNIFLNINKDENENNSVIDLNNGDALAILPSDHLVSIRLKNKSKLNPDNLNSSVSTQAMLIIQEA